jgi:hypothetical protein
MKSNPLSLFFGVVILTGFVVLSGCTTNPDVRVTQLQNQLEDKNQKLEDLRTDNQSKDSVILTYEKKLRQQQMATEDAQKQAQEAMASQTTSANTGDGSLFPPNASAGECFARVFVPPTYSTKTEQVLKEGASERLEVIPARYEWVEEKVLVKEASERIEVIPAEYTWKEEKVQVRPAASKLVEVPAKYDWQTDKVLVKEAHKVWKKGRGPIEKIDNTTGEIMCLVEVPASYKTVKKRVMVNPPSTKEVAVSAEYETVKKRVLAKPASQRKIVIPAEYKTVRVRKLVSPPQEKRIAIPEEYQTVTRTEMVTDGHMEWRRILCETNVTPDVIKKVQSGLRQSGYDPGPIDGVVGGQTTAALKSYQRSNNLAVGGLTYETMKKMGISN